MSTVMAIKQWLCMRRWRRKRNKSRSHNSEWCPSFTELCRALFDRSTLVLFSRSSSSSSSSRSAASAEMTWHQQASDSAEQPQLPSDVMAPGEQHRAFYDAIFFGTSC